MKALILISAITLASCASQVPVAIELQTPPELVLPKINADELECLTPEAYEKLVSRDILQSQRIITLTDIINSTRK